MMLTRTDWGAAAAVAALLFVVYSANGREIGSYDSQPSKFAARALLVRGSLTLNHDVGFQPLFLERSAYVATLDGNYRSAYSPVPSIAAAAIMWPFWKLHLFDVRAPAAPALIAAVAGAVITALAAAFAFLTARAYVSRGRALALALALGLGTGYWSTASQTLWQHETTILGLALAVFAFAGRKDQVSWPAAVSIGIGVGLAGSSRPQVSAAIAVLLAGTWVRGGWRRGALAAAIAGAFASTTMVYNVRWFGTPLGAAPMLEALHGAVHGTASSFELSAAGLAGLLVSPSRGLLIFSPIVGLCALGVPAMAAADWQAPARWCALAALCQYALYGSYSVWWGGHTFGPRYMLDVLPLLVPLGAEGAARLTTRLSRTLAVAAAAWSVVIAATGAFYYPNDRWNVDPADVDLHHERLWEWRRNQIALCWENGPSPQNFALFSRDAFRVPPR